MEPKPRNSILVIDGAPMRMRFLADTLAEEYDIFTATNGYKGINAAMNHTPALILLSQNLSDISGDEVMTALKYMKETKNIPIIFHAGIEPNTLKSKIKDQLVF